MAIALRCLAIAALGLFLLPASALADADVTRDATKRHPDGHRRLRRPGRDDDHDLAEPGRVTSSRCNAPLRSAANSSANCSGAGTTQVTCTPTATSIAVDMGDLRRQRHRRLERHRPGLDRGRRAATTRSPAARSPTSCPAARATTRSTAAAASTTTSAATTTTRSGARRERGADLLRRRQRLRPQRLHRHHRRVRDRHRRRRRPLQLRRRLQRRERRDLPGRARDLLQRDRRELQRARRREPRRRRRRLPAPGGLQRQRPEDPGRTRSRSAATTVDENCDRVASPWLRLPRGRVQSLGGRAELHAAARADPAQPAARRADRVQLRRQLVPVPQDQAADRALHAADHALARPDRQAPARRHRFRLSITASQTIGRTYTYTIRNGALPSDETRCKAPGRRAAARNAEARAAARPAAALLAPARASAGELSISGRTITYTAPTGTTSRSPATWPATASASRSSAKRHRRRTPAAHEIDDDTVECPLGR